MTAVTLRKAERAARTAARSLEARNVAIAAASRDGHSLRAIADAVHLSKARVHQIVQAAG